MSHDMMGGAIAQTKNGSVNGSVLQPRLTLADYYFVFS